MSFLIFLVLSTVLSTYSFPTSTLFKAVQSLDEPKCATLRNSTLKITEPDYLKTCPYPLDPKSSELNIIRCNLYLNQFNLLCSLPSVPIAVTTQYILSEQDLQSIAKSNLGKDVLSDTCKIFAMPMLINNNSNVDSFIVHKCETICKDIRSDLTDNLCIAASYLRLMAIKIDESIPKFKTVQNGENSGQIVNLASNNQEALMSTDNLHNKNYPLQQNKDENTVDHSSTNTEFKKMPIEDPAQGIRNFAPSGNAAPAIDTTGNAGVEQMPPQMTEEKKIDEPVNVSYNKNEDTLTSNSAKIATEQKIATLEQNLLPQEAVSADTKPKLVENAELKANVSIPSVNEKMSTENVATEPQGNVARKSTTPVKNDIDDSNIQNIAGETEYTDLKQFDNNNNTPGVAKHPGMTENEDENISRDMYRDNRTAEDDSYFFTYFMMLCVVFIFAYVGYHNKQKIIAIVVEGRRGSSGGGRGGRTRGGRRPNSANYHKLDSNLEEAVSSNTPNKNTSKVIY